MRRAYLVAASVILPVGIALAQQGSIQDGVGLLKQGKLEQALETFRDIERVRPENAAVADLIGITETQLGSFGEANREFARAIRLNPHIAEPHKNLGFNYLTLKEYDLAETQLREASALDSRDAFTHYYLAQVYLATSRDAEAVDELKPSGDLFENDAQGGFQMIEACLRVKQTSEAVSLITSLERRNYLSAQQEYALAQLLNRLGLYHASVQRFRRIVSMQPDSWVSRYNLAIALINDRNPEEAIAVLKRLPDGKFNDPDVLSLLGSAYVMKNEIPHALDAYQGAIRLDPQNSDRYLDYSRVLMDVNRYDEAEKVVTQGLERVNDRYSLTVRLGAIQMMQGHYSDAVGHYQSAILLHAAVPVAYVALAQVYMKQGRDQRAVQELEEARKLFPPDFAVEYVFGLALARSARTGEAIVSLQNAIRVNPRIPEPHYELGKLYGELQQWKAAESQFEVVLKLAPQNAQAHYQLSRVYSRMGERDRSKEMAKSAAEMMQEQRDHALAVQQARVREFMPE